MDYGTLLQQYPGYQGWGQTEALADYNATGGSGKGPQTSGGSSGSLDTSSIPSTQSYVQGQFTGEDPYIQAILDKYNTAEKPLDIYTRLENEAGVPQLRTTAGNLMKEVSSIEDILSGIEPDVAARTKDSLVTEAMRRGLVQSKSEPWMEKLTKLGTGLGRVMEGLSLARQDIGTKVSLAMQGLEQELKPLEFAYSVKVDRNARLLSGFTDDKETALSTLIANWQRTNEISDRDYQTMQQLASEERSYNQELQKIALNAGVSITGSESTNELLKVIGQGATKISEEYDWADSWWS